jgi:ABC-type polysaccharide/polyol phosphate transport system ATPase subunit
MTDAALEIESLSKSFRVPRADADADPRRERLSRRSDRFWALRDVSLSVERGRTLGLVGANGSGKSTLLKILAGVMTPGGGRFQAQGRVGALLELGAGFHPDLTGLQNVYLNGALLGLSLRQVNALLPDIIAFAELERFMDMPVRHFSSGMSARLGFAVATRLAPEILLMDETFAAGDAGFQGKALSRVAELKRSGHTLVLVSHNLEVVLALCDQVAWLDRGRLRLVGAPFDVVAQYQRDQQLDLREVGLARDLLGMEAMFAATMGDGAPARVAEARLARESGGAAGAGAEPLAIGPGDGARLELEIAHAPQGAPEALWVETAWTRGDGRVVAQGRSRVRLAVGRASTRCRLHWNPWPLVDGEYRLALALSPVDGRPADPATGALHYDRRLGVGAIRSMVPNPVELPILTPLPCRWETTAESQI